MSMKLTVPQSTYERRLERMASLIGMRAPAIIIYNEARLIIRACHPSFWNRIKSAFMGMWYGLVFKFVKPDIPEEPLDFNEQDFAPEWTPEAVHRLLREIMASPTTSFDAETTPVPDCKNCPCRCHVEV